MTTLREAAEAIVDELEIYCETKKPEHPEPTPGIECSPDNCGPMMRTEEGYKATIAELRERLAAQVRQTNDTYKQIADKVIEKLQRHNAIPEGLDVHGHPIEQVVGTCISAMAATIAELREQLEVAESSTALTQQALAWQSVVVALNSIDSGWSLNRSTGEEAAIAAIQKMHAELIALNANQRTTEDVANAKFIAKFIKLVGAAEMKAGMNVAEQEHVLPVTAAAKSAEPKEATEHKLTARGFAAAILNASLCQPQDAMTIEAYIDQRVAKLIGEKK